MKNHPELFLLFILTIFIGYSPVNGQVKKDSVKNFKNTIRTNITNPLLFGKNYNVIGYERVVSKNQSISFNIGRFSLPTFSSFSGDSLGLQRGSTDKGFTFAVDYRFYLKKENRYGAPRGIYVGPYYSFNSLVRDNTWTLNTANMKGDVESTIRLNANLVGAQMGYQFIIKNRVTIDLIFMGPGVWFYSLRTKLNTTLDPEDEALLFEKINGFLASKLPGHDITISPGEKNRSGSIRLSSFGFRYVIHLGFRF